MWFMCGVPILWYTASGSLFHSSVHPSYIDMVRGGPFSAGFASLAAIA